MTENLEPIQKYFDGRGEKWEGWVEKFLTYGWSRRHLPAGDFMFNSYDKKVVGIEAKTVSDLASRLGDAKRELSQLIDTVDIPIILIFGKWVRKSNDILLGGQDQLTWNHLWNLLETFQDSGLRFKLALSRDHAFLRINQLFAYYLKAEHSSTLVPRKAKQDRRIASLMPIPGVSRKLGIKLLDKFGSLQGVANASENLLEQTPLIGTKKAQMIQRWFSMEGPYR